MQAVTVPKLAKENGLIGNRRDTGEDMGVFPYLLPRPGNSQRTRKCLKAVAKQVRLLLTLDGLAPEGGVPPISYLPYHANSYGAD